MTLTILFLIISAVLMVTGMYLAEINKPVRFVGLLLYGYGFVVCVLAMPVPLDLNLIEHDDNNIATIKFKECRGLMWCKETHRFEVPDQELFNFLSKYEVKEEE